MTDAASAAQKLVGDISPKLAELTDDVLFGDVWERQGLAKRDRSLLTISTLMATGAFEQLAAHIRIGLGNGLTKDEIAEAITHLAFYAGWPKSMSAIQDVVAGGEVHSVRMVSSTRVAFSLRPPQPLDAGDEHEFFFRIRVAELPSPFYCCTPEFPCESFDLNVRFDRRRPPQRVWRIDGEFSKDAQDPLTARKPLFLDNAGEVHTGFRNLRPAQSYGVGWQPDATTNQSSGQLHTH